MEKAGRIIGAFKCFCAALAAILLFGVAPAFADTSVGGTLSTNMTWSAAGSPYLVTSTVIIASGATLTVDAGVVVRFQSGIGLTVQNGALRARGTALSPVLFTSWRDTSGNSPAAGDWGGIQFQNGTIDSRTILDQVTVRYGTTTTLVAASPTFNHCSFENNSGYALSLDLASFPHGSGNSASGNGVNAIRVPAGEMTASGAWDLTAIPYHLDGEVSIGVAPRLTSFAPTDVEQNSSIMATLGGSRLAGAKTVSIPVSGLTTSILPGASDTAVPVQITTDNSAPFGLHDITVSAAAGSASLVNGINIIPPIPRLTGVAPDHIFINRPATTVDITGQNLTAGTTAYLNGVSLVTTFTSSLLVQAVVPLQTLPTLGQLLVKNPDPRAPGSYLDSSISLFTVDLPQFAFSPGTLTLHQGDVSSLDLTIPYAAPAGGITANLSSTNITALTVPASITIPEGATTTLVPVTALASGATGTTFASVNATAANWTSGAAQVTIRQQQTVNLTPTTTVTGNGWTYYLTVSLLEAAPVSGVTVTLTSSPSGTAPVVSCPATVFIPQGGTSAQVTVTAVNPGFATITATAPSPILSGTTNAVTVKSVNTFNVAPVLGPPVGVLVSQTTSTALNVVSYTPVSSTQVGVAVGAVITGLSPNHAAIGATGLLVRVYGSGLASATSMTFNPSAGIHMSSFFAASDGSYVESTIDIDQTAPVTARTVVLGGVTAWPTVPGANQFSITYQPPQLWSLLPNYGLTGSTFTLQVNGRNLQQASEIAFIPPDGISVGNPPAVSADGTLASVSVTISSNTATGMRTVMITAPGGVTSGISNDANSFEVRSATPPIGNTYAVYTPVVAPSVGVLVSQPTVTTLNVVSYAPVLSLPVGVVSGSSFASVSPASGTIGSTGLVVRVNGSGLASATSMTFNPSTGITIHPSSFTAASDYAESTIDIDQTAPVTARTVVLGGVTAWPAVPGANRFSVTYQPPQLWSLLPNYGLTGSTFTLQVNGRNLQQASEIAFIPPDGISLGNPPAVSADGTLASVSVTISSNTVTGMRVVKITAPGGATAEAPSDANTFEVRGVTPPIGSAYAAYAPVLAPSVGVMVTTPTATTQQLVGYGPVESAAVGVAVQSAPTPTATSVNYSPVSLPVGVTVGSAIAGITPNILRPGTTTNITILGVGLNAVNALQIQPSAGFTIGAITPAPDGSSALVSVTTDTNVSVGAKTVIVSSASGTISAAAPGANSILAGPPPAIVSIVPFSQNFDTTFTLTINGTHLQGATAVRFDTPDGILVNNPPAYTTDAQGEHLSVTVIISATVVGGQRTVIVSTPYGESDLSATDANSFTVVSVAWNTVVPLAETVITASTTPLPTDTSTSSARIDPQEPVVAVNAPASKGGEKGQPDRTSASDGFDKRRPLTDRGRVIIVIDARRGYRLFAGYRGPPLAEV